MSEMLKSCCDLVVNSSKCAAGTTHDTEARRSPKVMYQLHIECFPTHIDLLRVCIKILVHLVASSNEHLDTIICTYINIYTKFYMSNFVSHDKVRLV